MSCGLTTSARVSACAAASRLETTATPYFSSSSRGALGALLADQQLGDRATGADQAGEQGLAHDAGAEDAVTCVVEDMACAYFLEIRDRTKNVRFCGRSARRLMR